MKNATTDEELNGNENTERSDFNHSHLPDPWLEVVLLAVMPAAVLSALFWLFTKDLGTSLSIGFGIWGLIYFWKLKKKFWVKVASDKEVIIQDEFKKPKELVSSRDITDPCYSPRGTRSAGAGLHALGLGESVVKVIDTTTPVPITSVLRNVMDGDKLTWNVTARIMTTPLRGRWSVRSLFVDEPAANIFFEGVLDAAVRQGFAKTGGWEVSRFKEKFTKDNFINILGGPGRIVMQEIQYARSAGLPYIVEVEATERTEEILNRVRAAKSKSDAIKILRKSGVSTEIASAIASGEKVNFISLIGSGANSPVAQAVVAETMEEGNK